MGRAPFFFTSSDAHLPFARRIPQTPFPIK